MGIWVYVVPPAAVILVALAVAILLIRRRWRRRKSADGLDVSVAERGGQGMIPRRMPQVSPHHLDRVWSKRTGKSSWLSPEFRWEDHPSLIADAVEHGWSRFGFTVFASSPAKSMAGLLASCVADEQPGGVSIGWEIVDGSSEFVQKVRLNPTRRTVSDSSAFSVIRTALPLPGPNLGNSAFPQEAYFEITVLSFDGGDENSGGEIGKKNEGDKVKLIADDSNNTPEILRSVLRSHRSQKRNNNRTDEVKIESKNDAVPMSVGLCGGGPLQIRVPGSFPGSIGFNSSGSVFLEGVKISDGSEKFAWETRDKVVGCGFDPLRRRVFFTVDGKEVHEIIPRKSDFAAPLYPTVAANVDVTVSVNLGQRPFEYPPANLSRSSKPASVSTPETPPAPFFERSNDLFSVGRIDSDWWLRRDAAVRSNQNMVNHIRTLEYEHDDSDGDLFEIALDGVSNR